MYAYYYTLTNQNGKALFDVGLQHYSNDINVGEGNSLGNRKEEGMSRDSCWCVEDVMEYFGKELDSEERARAVMGLAEKELQGQERVTYFSLMNQTRDILIRSGYSVPFRAVYRRAK